VDDLQATQAKKATDSVLWGPLKHFIIRHLKSSDGHGVIDVDKRRLMVGYATCGFAACVDCRTVRFFTYCLELSGFRAGHPRVHAHTRIASHRCLQQAAAVVPWSSSVRACVCVGPGVFRRWSLESGLRSYELCHGASYHAMF